MGHFQSRISCVQRYSKKISGEKLFTIHTDCLVSDPGRHQDLITYDMYNTHKPLKKKLIKIQNRKSAMLHILQSTHVNNNQQDLFDQTSLSTLLNKVAGKHDQLNKIKQELEVFLTLIKSR